MLQNNKYRILELFFDSPTKKFQLREISRLVKLGLLSVINHIKYLEKEKFIKKEEGNYSWGSTVEKIYYELGENANPTGSTRVRDYFQKKDKEPEVSSKPELKPKEEIKDNENVLNLLELP